MTEKMLRNPFTDLPRTPTEHFRLFFYAAVLNLLHQVTKVFDSREAAFAQFPFLAGYNNELAQNGLAGVNSVDALTWWLESLRDWEATATEHLPLRALREAALLDHSAMTLLVSIGLIEEDVRFGSVFEAMQGTPGQHRPTLSLLGGWWREENGWTIGRVNLRRLQESGLVRVVNAEAPRLEWALEVPGPLWDALRGEQNAAPAPWLRYRSRAKLPTLDELILPAELHEHLKLIPGLLASGEAQALIVRGAQRNGRRTLLGAVAHALGRNLLEVNGLAKAEDERWPVVGPLATALYALPVITFDLAPEETAVVARLTSYDGPSGIVLGKQGGVSGDGVDRALTVTIEMPDPELRRLHWLRASSAEKISDVVGISERLRLTGGNIQRAARLAQTYAALSGRQTITLADVQEASRALNRQTLDALAAHLKTSGDWNQLAVGTETCRELENLESRCRHREHLRDAVGSALGSHLNPGVRALFSGPSGTGKTLAARLLAAVLQMDLYRLDLSAVVNKYIGETEKNLNQIFSRAEELDVILLLDEGDALLTQRTGVQSSNDRYANLETNFLLQRLESFEGILIVTTNAGDRIDSAFRRRMDVVINFPTPDAMERWAIWQLHLPPAHLVEDSLLEDVAHRCELTGGQIRNAILHASLLALNDGGRVTSAHLEAAVQREYSKAGAVCPLRSYTASLTLSRW
jgi:hypothetical protein